MVLARRAIDALDAVLGDKAFLMGDAPHVVPMRPCSRLWLAAGVDGFESELVEIFSNKPRLVAYKDRCMSLVVPRRASPIAASDQQRQAMISGNRRSSSSLIMSLS